VACACRSIIIKAYCVSLFAIWVKSFTAFFSILKISLKQKHNEKKNGWYWQFDYEKYEKKNSVNFS
jgi:hypothetical protein